MKKNFENKTQMEIENSLNNIGQKQQAKTTDVNILLNRVRLDKKKTFKKRLIISFINISLISLVVTYLII